MSLKGSYFNRYFYAGIVVGAITSQLLTRRRKKFLVKTKRTWRQSSVEPDLDNDINILRKTHVMIDVIERDIIPLTCTAVCDGGNKLDGAAVLFSDSLNLVLACTNQESRCPIYNSVSILIGEFYDMMHSLKSRAISAESCIILSSYKPSPTNCEALFKAEFNTIFYLFEEIDTSGSGMTCSCNQPQQPGNIVSILELIDSISQRRRNRGHVVDPNSHIAPEESVSAMDLAISAAVDSLIVNARRRIDQLKLAYIKINDERLSHPTFLQSLST